MSYNTAINACGRAGSVERAHELLHEMQPRSGVKPDTVRRGICLCVCLVMVCVWRVGLA